MSTPPMTRRSAVSVCRCRQVMMTSYLIIQPTSERKSSLVSKPRLGDEDDRKKPALGQKENVPLRVTPVRPVPVADTAVVAASRGSISARPYKVLVLPILGKSTVLSKRAKSQRAWRRARRLS